MKNIIIALTLVCCVYPLAAYAQDAVAPAKTKAALGTPVSAKTPADTTAGAVQAADNNADTADRAPTDVVQSDDDGLDRFDDSDSADVSKPDNLSDFDSDDDIEIVDAPADSADAAQKLGSVKRGYDRKRQVTLAIVMMAFLILALGTSQSFNPK